ncbi:hypothetical protein ACWEU6_21840 [Streptosporangium sandarakinum]
MTQITHPQILGSEVDVPESSLPFHQAAGWVVKGSQDDPEVTAAERERDLKLNGPGEAAAEQDQAPKARRATTKEADA